MKAFTFVRPATVEEAATAAKEKGSVIKAGGTDLLDRMKERIDEPERVVWLGEVRSGWRGFTEMSGSELAGSLQIGAMTTLAEIAASSKVRERHPALAEAAALAASPQIRAQATLAGNLCQHTRCGYYRHRSFPCVKRGDAECPVLRDGAVQDTAAIFENRTCASAHPSSLAPALCALDAIAYVATPGADTKTPIQLSKLYGAPKRGTAADVVLPPGGVIEMVLVPANYDFDRRSVYEEVRQKAAFDWSLASCCVYIETSGGKIANARVWLGSVAPTPWHAEAAEKALAGKTLTEETIRAAADAAVTGATPLPGNAYKVDLVKVVVRRALERLRSAK